MELKQLAPWNWFKKEQETQAKLPVARRMQSNGHYPAGPAGPMEQLFDEFVRSFSSLTPMLSGMSQPIGGQAWLKPSIDIAASDAEYTITAELPGVDENEVSVDVVDDTLTISGRKENVKEERHAQYYCMERSYGSFQRALSLPDDADADAITAAFKKGVLTITVPRRPSQGDRGRRIAIRAA